MCDVRLMVDRRSVCNKQCPRRDARRLRRATGRRRAPRATRAIERMTTLDDVDALDAVVRDAFARTNDARATAKAADASRALDALKRDARAWAVCLRAYSRTTSSETKFWCLQTLTEALAKEARGGGTTMSDEDAETLRRALGACVSEATGEIATGGDGGDDRRSSAATAASSTSTPAFVKNKLAQACAYAVALEYPERWPSFFADLANLLSRGTQGVDMFTRVLEAIDEELIATVDAGRAGKEDFARSMRIKEAMRADGSLRLVFDAWRQCLEHYARVDPRVATRVWSVARRYVEWVDVGLVASEEYVKGAKECLMLDDLSGAADESLRAAAVGYLHAVITKGMETSAKVRLIISTKIVEVCARLQVICAATQDDFDEEFVTQVTNLAAAVAAELLNANKVENITALGVELSAEVSSSLHQVTPLVLSSISFKHERAVLVALPFLTAYIGYMKSQPALLNAAQPALTSACQALIARGAFPTEHIDGLDWNDGSNALTQEFEADVFSLRAELNVQLKNIARLAPHLAREVVRQVLMSAVVGSGEGNQLCWQNVEVAISALFTLGEGADDAAVKPMSIADRAKATNGTGEVTDTPLGALVVSLIREWGTSVGRAAYHRLVAPTFLEICVRYHAVLERDDAALVAALTAFLDERGIGHVDLAVRSRACYLISRLSRPLRCKLSDKVENIMCVLPAYLTEFARSLPEPTTQNAAFVSVSAAGIQSRAMAESGNDDRLYLFEAFGTMLGADEVKEEEQYRYLSQIAAGLCRQIEEVAAGGQSGEDAPIRIALATRAIVAFGNISKGFSQRTCLTSRPRTGEVFRSCLEMSLRCLDVWPRDASVRNRATGFLHRMIDLLGPTVTPYLAPTVHKLRRDADAVELRETLVLFNQLASTYAAELAPFVVEVLPGLAAQIFNTISSAYAQASVESVGGSIATNTEVVREADELERMWLTTTAALGANALIAPTFTGYPNTKRTAPLREQLLSHLVQAAQSHGMVSARKVALTALKSFVEEWTLDTSPDEPPSLEGAPTSSAPAKGPRDERVPGFTRFVVERVCVECCILPPIRGDLDLSDAVSVGALNESFAILAVVHARQSDALTTALTHIFRHSILPSHSPDRIDAIVNEYIRVLAAAAAAGKPHLRSTKPARALVDAVRREIAAAPDRGRTLDLTPRLAKRGV